MYGIQSQERRYHYSGIAVPVCWNSSAIPAGIFNDTTDNGKGGGQTTKDVKDPL